MITFSSNPQSIPVYKKVSRYLDGVSREKLEESTEYIAEYIEDALHGKIAESTDISAYLSRKKRNAELNKQYSKDKSISNQAEMDSDNKVVLEDRLAAPVSQNDYHKVDQYVDSVTYDDVDSFFLMLVKFIEEDFGYNLVELLNQISEAQANNKLDEYNKAKSILAKLIVGYNNLFDLDLEKFLTDISLPDKVADILEESGLSFSLEGLITHVISKNDKEKLGFNIDI